MSGYRHSGWTQEEYEARTYAMAVMDGEGVHTYLSTSCLHGEHDYCQGTKGVNSLDGQTWTWTKIPKSCKFCKAPCICACHEEGADVAA